MYFNLCLQKTLDCVLLLRNLELLIFIIYIFTKDTYHKFSVLVCDSPHYWNKSHFISKFLSFLKYILLLLLVLQFLNIINLKKSENKLPICRTWYLVMTAVNIYKNLLFWNLLQPPCLIIDRVNCGPCSVSLLCLWYASCKMTSI